MGSGQVARGEHPARKRAVAARRDKAGAGPLRQGSLCADGTLNCCLRLRIRWLWVESGEPGLS